MERNLLKILIIVGLLLSSTSCKKNIYSVYDDWRLPTIDELKKRKIPIVAVDKSLNKFDGKVMFPEKLEKANEMLKRIGLPKQVAVE